MAIFAMAGQVEAQVMDNRPAFILVDPATKAAGGRDFDVAAAMRKARSRFQLFAEGDRAWTSLRMVGDNVIWETNTGPGDDIGGPMFNLFSPITQFSTASGTFFQTFGIPMMWGVPRSEWVQYLVEGVESLSNAKGEPPGWTVMWNGEIFGRPKDMNAADGLVGSLLSGVVSTTDGSCLDHSANLGGASLLAGFQLLPGSNCKPTWSNGGTEWQGDRPIPIDTWIEIFNERGANFEFNRWQVPMERKDQTKFMGNNFATYGHFNDYNITVLKKFGNVIPGGTGDPSRQGYPLGLDVYFDAFTFTVPTVANAKFWGGLIVNNSQALYGVAHDYDSIYVGFGPWPGRRQDGDNYMRPELGAWVSAESSDPGGPDCARTKDVPLIGNSCGGFDGGRQNGFETGAHGMIVLKSPIGDLRNKLFTRPGPFFMPSHPLAGDTITYNHSVNWNFGPWGDVWNQGTDRRRFGVLSSTPANALDGTACPDFFSANRRWRLFQSNGWPDADKQCDFGGWVPGDWHYTSHRPLGAGPGPDTLFLATCGPFDGGACPEPWADTTWQGWSANSFGNLSEFHIGPFRLEAGDTAEILIAMYSGKDSVAFEGFTQGIVDFYLGFFAGPEAPPRVTIRDVDLGAGVTSGQDAAVTLVWDDGAENFEDPFLLKLADDMEAAAPGTDLGVIRDANPGIVDRIRARARDNLKELLIFRSCDGGNTFDGDGDCEGDPTLDEFGGSIEPGWQAFATLGPDGSGDFPNTFTDGSVTPGLTFLYTILGRSKGFEEVVITDPNARVDTLVDPANPADTSIVFTCGINACETDTLKAAPSLLNPLSRSSSDPNVVSVYVPASVAAGGAPASVEFTDRDATGKSTVPFDVILTSSSGLRENTFRARFGNQITVAEDRDVTTDSLISVSVTVEDLARTVVGDTGTVTADLALTSVTYTRSDGVPVTLNDATLVSEDTVAGVITRTFRIGPGNLDPNDREAIGFALVEETAGGTVPLLASGKLEGDAATPGAFLASPAFPGFLISADNRPAGTFDETLYTDQGGDTLSAELEPSLGLDQSATQVAQIQGVTLGESVLTFTDSVFGPLSPFRLNEAAFADPDALDAVFDQSLAQRAGTTAATDDSTRALVAAELGLDPADVTLVAANIPFSVTNITFGRTATLAMVDRGEVRKILGLGRDTLSVSVAADRWIPEDPVFVIEDVELFRTRDVGGTEAIVVTETGAPVKETRRVVTSQIVLTCGGQNTTCNPVVDQGSGEWIGVRPTDELHIKFFSPFAVESEFAFVPSRAISGEDIMSQGRSITDQMDAIRVVPNPYLFFSEFETTGAARRLMFTNLPPDGELRIYTVSGNFVQEIDWSPADLSGNGDLFWDMQTREGNELGAGLFLFVVEAVDPATGKELKKMGKFVVIR